MVVHKLVVFLAILDLLCIIPGILLAEEDLSPEQLFLLMKASSEQYNTFDAKIKVTNYHRADKESEIKLTRDIVWRWTKSRSFSRIVRTEYGVEIQDEDYSTTFIKTFAITPKWSKCLVEAQDNRTPRGYVESGMAMERRQSFYNIHDVMWKPFGYPLERFSTDDSTATFDEDKGYYILKTKFRGVEKSSVFTLHIDSSKGFIPVEMEYVMHDGTLIARCECNDLRQTKVGLWVPYRYSWIDPRRNITFSYEVEEVKVNEPIPEHLLDFAFPKGTVVIDEIANLRYIVNDEATQAAPQKVYRNIYYLILPPVLLGIVVLLITYRFVSGGMSRKT